MTHKVKGFSVVSEAEVDVFLEFPLFYYVPTDIGNLISGSSDFSKLSLYIWKFSVHIPLKSSLWDLRYYLASMGVSLVAQMVKNLPAVQETRVLSLGREDPLEKEMATHPSILAWKISRTEEHGRYSPLITKRRTQLSE